MLIKVDLENADNYKKLDYRKIRPLQGNLKILKEEDYKKLKKSLEEKGYFVPVFVWFDGQSYWMEDGHGRLRLFKNEDARFYYDLAEEQDATYEIPVLEIRAKDMKDAKEKLLIITSQYQKIVQEGLDEFSIELDESWVLETTNFDALDFAPIPLEDDEIQPLKEKDTIYRVYFDCQTMDEQGSLFDSLRKAGFDPKLQTIE